MQHISTTNSTIKICIKNILNIVKYFILFRSERIHFINKVKNIFNPKVFFIPGSVDLGKIKDVDDKQRSTHDLCLVKQPRVSSEDSNNDNDDDEEEEDTNTTTTNKNSSIYESSEELATNANHNQHHLNVAKSKVSASTSTQLTPRDMRELMSSRIKETEGKLSNIIC